MHGMHYISGNPPISRNVVHGVHYMSGNPL